MKKENHVNLIEQVLELLQADYLKRRPLLTTEQKKNGHPVEIGHKLFESWDSDTNQTIGILINPYTFSRITANDWCIEVEKYMQKFLPPHAENSSHDFTAARSWQ